MSELTIEQMRQIVDGAPDWAKGYNTAIQKYTRSVWFSKDILLSDLKAQIDQHYYGQSEEKELEQYAILSQEKIEGGAVLVGGSSIQKMVDYQDVIASQQSEIEKLKAEKAGLEKLIKDWRKSANWMCATDDKHVINSLRSCADDLEKVLRGGHENTN